MEKIIITSLRMMVIIGSTAAIIATVLLPKATSGAALLPTLADRHCCRPTPTPTTNDHDHDGEDDTTPPPSPPRADRHVIATRRHKRVASGTKEQRADTPRRCHHCFVGRVGKSPEENWGCVVGNRRQTGGSDDNDRTTMNPRRTSAGLR